MNEEEKDTQTIPTEEAPTEPKIDESVPEPVSLDTQASEPVSVPETPTINAVETLPETPTPQTSGNEPLPPTANEGAEVKHSAPEEQPRTPAREERKHEEAPKEHMGLLQKIARATIGLRKEKKLAKILTLFAKQTEITNNQVEKLLHVSDATATRYLNELEKRGKLTQHGKTGHAVTYTKR